MKEYIFNNTYYRINDFKQGRPLLVFIHGLTGSSSAWKKYEERFENNYNLLTYDLRGHGRTAKPKNYGDYEIKNFVQDLSELLKHMNITTFNIVSHSFGTLIALGFLAEQQDMVRSVIFLSPVFALKKRRLARIIEPLVGITKIFDRLPFSGKAGQDVDYSRYENTGDWNLRRMLADIPNTSLRVYFYCIRQSYNFKYDYFLSLIKIPVLIIHGKKDTIYPFKNSEEIAKKINNSQIILLDDANHIVVLNNFFTIAEAIEKFIQKN